MAKIEFENGGRLRIGGASWVFKPGGYVKIKGGKIGKPENWQFLGETDSTQYFQVGPTKPTFQKPIPSETERIGGHLLALQNKVKMLESWHKGTKVFEVINRRLDRIERKLGLDKEDEKLAAKFNGD